MRKQKGNKWAFEKKCRPSRLHAKQISLNSKGDLKLVV